MAKNIINIIWFVFISLSIIFLCGFAHQWKYFLQVENIEVEGEYLLSKEEVVKLIDIPMGISIYEVSLDKLNEQLRVQKYIKEVVISRKYFNSLNIRIIERKPLAAVMLNKLWFIDTEGILLPKINSETIIDLPVISGASFDPLNNVGNNITDEYVNSALELLTAAINTDEEMYSLISEIHINRNKELIVYSSDYGVPIIFGESEYSEKIEKLSIFWKEVVVRNGADNLTLVDIRFSDQIIAKWKNGNIKKSINKQA